MRCREIDGDLAPCADLRGGQLEWEGLLECAGQLVFCDELGRSLGVAGGAGFFHRQLLRQQFVELDTPPSWMGAFGQAGKRSVRWRPVQRQHARREIVQGHFVAQEFGQRILELMTGRKGRERTVDQASQLDLRKARSGRVNGCQRFRYRIARLNHAIARMDHLRAKKSGPHFAEQAHPSTGCELLDLTAVEIQKPKINHFIAVLRLHHQLAARTVGDFGMDNFGFQLARHAGCRISNTGQPRFILIANRQVQRKIPILAQIEPGEFG